MTSQSRSILRLLQTDKKTSAGVVHFVLPKEIGRIEVVRDVPDNVVQRGGRVAGVVWERNLWHGRAEPWAGFIGSFRLRENWASRNFHFAQEDRTLVSD